MEFLDIFARNCFDNGINTKFNVQRTPLDNKPAYSQSLPAPINHKDDILVELALLHKDGIIATLLFSKYASPIVAQRERNGKRRLLVDLRKIDALTSDNYINNNHPVSTLTDATQNMAGKYLFCKLDCSLLITAFKWLTSNQSNSLHSSSQVEHSHTEAWHKHLVVPYRHFRASYANISMQSSKTINVLNTLTLMA